MRYILFTLFLVANLSTYAQNDKVFLKNGSIIKGRVDDAKLANEEITLEVEGQNISIPFELVDEIRFKKREDGSKPGRYSDLIYPKGFRTNISTGLLLGNHSYNDPLKAYLSLEAAQFYNLHPLLNVGVGLAYNGYKEYSVVPAFMEYQVLLGKRQRSLFFYGKAGYSLLTTINEEDLNRNDAKGGRLLEAGMGWQKQLGKNYLQIKLGYSSQSVSEDRDLWYFAPETNSTLKYERKMNRMMFMITYGISN